MSNKVKGKRKWSKEEAMKFLKNAGVNVVDKRILILNRDSTSAPGLTALGAADYLKNNHYYSLNHC